MHKMKFITKKNIKFPKRESDSKKGDNGRVLIIGGSKEYVGCLALAGIAALRTGCDWVTVAAPEKVAWAINELSPDLVTIKLKGDYLSIKHFEEIKILIEKHDIILIGNGAGLRKEAKNLFKKIIKIKKYFVIDADAIKGLSLNEINNSIITPHKGELKILLKNSKIKIDINSLTNNNKKMEIIKKNIKDNTLLIKGKTDIIISKNKIFFNKTGNAGMTKGGTGDILAGLCAGFLAQNKDLLQSAINAAYINGVLGDLQLKKHKGYSYIASDLLEDISSINKSLRK